MGIGWWSWQGKGVWLTCDNICSKEIKQWALCQQNAVHEDNAEILTRTSHFS